MAEFHLVCSASHGQRDDLATEAYSHEGHDGRQIGNGPDRGAQQIWMSRVPGAVGYQEAVDL
ncbi:hypothetical protein SDC9_189309 [bioreactor metagenome]|uniref:Uncharacterized protein n=1 Tax=bioreactor metagenome TaxID=1076179 RepID=A0A645I017_9ZZZZ